MSGDIEDLKNHVIALSKKIDNFCDGFLNSGLSNDRINEVLNIIHDQNFERSRINSVLFEEVYPDLARRVAFLEEKILMNDRDERKNNILEKSIHDLELTVRAARCLRAQGIDTIGSLMRNSRQDLRRIPNLGSHSLRMIENSMEKIGLKLKD